MSTLRIKATRGRVEPDEPQVGFGAITVYASTGEILQRETTELSESILKCAAEHLSVAKNVLNKLARERLGIDRIDRQLFGALLGGQLRLGRLESIVCSSINDKNFRVYVHRDQINRFHEGLLTARELLTRETILHVEKLEKRVFGSRRYNTWSSTSHLLGRLCYLGIAEQIDKYSARLTPGLQSAISIGG